MDLRRSRWILGVVLANLALVGTPAGADEPNFTEEQKIDFMQHAKVIASKPQQKGKSNASHLTLSDGKVTHDASFQPIDERKLQGPAPGPSGGMELNFGLLGVRHRWLSHCEAIRNGRHGARLHRAQVEGNAGGHFLAGFRCSV